MAVIYFHSYVPPLFFLLAKNEKEGSLVRSFTFSGFSVHQVINDGVGSILPSSIQKTILEGIFTIGRAQLAESLLNEKNPLVSSRLAKVRRIFEEGKSLQLQFPAEDLGFRYCLSIIIHYTIGILSSFNLARILSTSLSKSLLQMF